jgi:hypothetical protein
MCFCYTDIQEHNVIPTPNDELYIIDFEHAAFLPVSCMSYALWWSPAGYLAANVGERIEEEDGLAKQTPTLTSMAHVQHIYCFVNQRIGLCLFHYLANSSSH